MAENTERRPAGDGRRNDGGGTAGANATLGDQLDDLDLLGVPLFALERGSAKGIKGKYRAPDAWPDTRPEDNDLDQLRGAPAVGAVGGAAFDYLDFEADGADDLAALAADGLIPEVHSVVATPSGGWHLYVRPLGLPNRVKPERYRMDIRAAGGFVLVPPTPGYRVLPRDEWPDLGAQPADAAERLRALFWRERGVAVQYDPSEPATAEERRKAERVLAKAAREMADAQEGTRNNTLNEKAFVLYGFAAAGCLDENDVTDALMQAAEDAGLDMSEIVATLGSACDAAPPLRPQVSSTGRDCDVSNNAEAAEWLVREVGQGGLSGVFRRGDTLVHTPRVGEDGYVPPANDHDSDGPAQVRRLGATEIAARIDRAYDVTGYLRTEKRVVAKLFPEVVAGRVLATPDLLPNVHDLLSVVHTPSMRADGSVLAAPGFDAASRVLYLPDAGLDVPAVPDRPTAAQVTAAGRLLLTMVEGFPFVTPHDRANYLGALLTPLLRPMTPPPYKLLAIGAPQRGSGKSLLAWILREVHGGVFRSEMPRSDEELRKAITAMLDTTSAPVVQFDNVTGQLRSPVLDGLLTSVTWSDRLLGVSKQLTLRNDRLWVVTGNNLNIGGDLARRTLWVTIDAGMEHPETRSDFTIPDLEAWLRDQRGAVLHALLVLVRAWVCAGRPMQQRPTSDGFGTWVAVLRGVLDHAALGPQVGTVGHVESVREGADSEAEEWATFLAAVRRVVGRESWRVRDLIERVDPLVVGADDSIHLEELPEAVADKWFNGRPGSVSRTLGKWLQNRDRRWAGGLAVEGLEDSRLGRRWRVIENGEELL